MLLLIVDIDMGGDLCSSKVIPASLTAGVIASEVNWSWGYIDCFRWSRRPKGYDDKRFRLSDAQSEFHVTGSHVA